jgi:hypothetical protein
MKTLVALKDFLTDAEIKKALYIWQNYRSEFYAKILAEIVRPAMPEINRKLKQDNVPGFIAYLIEHIFTENLQ